MNDDDTSKAGASMEPEREPGRARLRWPVVGVALLALQVGTASAVGDDFGRHGFCQEVHGQLDAQICRRHRLSEETRAWCDSIAGLSGRDLYKAIVEANLRCTNQPPVADLKLDLVQPHRVDLNARDSTDADGFPHIYYFRLEDAKTGEVVAGPVTTREPVATLRLNGKRPQKVRAVVVVEHDERALDTATMDVDLPASCGSNANVYCYPRAGEPEITTCTPTQANFTASDLLEAAGQCNPDITVDTPVVFAAAGAAGGRGADSWPNDGSPGGLGGLAALGTTLDQLNQEFRSGTSYCYGIGNVGGYTDTNSGTGRCDASEGSGGAGSNLDSWTGHLPPAPMLAAQIEHTGWLVVLMAPRTQST